MRQHLCRRYSAPLPEKPRFLALPTITSKLREESRQAQRDKSRAKPVPGCSLTREPNGNGEPERAEGDKCGQQAGFVSIFVERKVHSGFAVPHRQEIYLEGHSSLVSYSPVSLFTSGTDETSLGWGRGPLFLSMVRLTNNRIDGGRCQ